MKKNILFERGELKMSFGYVPDYKNNLLMDLFLRVFGLPIIPRRLEAKRLFKMLRFYKPKTIIDVACGDGVFCIEMAKTKADVIGIDLSLPKLRLATDRIKKMNLGKKISLIRCDAQFLPLINGFFACAVCNCSLEHFPNDLEALLEISRVLKKGGCFFLSVPNSQRPVFFPIIAFWIKMPKIIRKVFAPRFLEGNFKSGKEAVHHLQYVIFKDLRGYEAKKLQKKLLNCGFKVDRIEYSLQIFSAIVWDLILGTKALFLNIIMAALFPFMYPIALLDEFFVRRDFPGGELIVYAQKGRRSN